jgi:soluble lytic murein transglycosylase-like protein
MRLLGLVLLAAGTAFAGEYAVLSSGARLHVDRHEVDGSRIRLFNGDGYTEMAAREIRSFEAEEAAPAPAPEAPPPAVEPIPVVRTSVLQAPEDLADAAADKYHLPRELVRSVMRVESGFQPAAVSPKGAIGLMQLMPETAADLGVNPYDPAQNVDGGVRYLRDLLVKYNWALWHALAAYNAGPAAVEKYNGIPPYRETLNYVTQIDRAYKAEQARQ